MLTKAEAKVESTKEASKYPGLQYQPDPVTDRGHVFRAIRRYLRAQFGRPTGFWGNIAGAIMAGRRSNNERIEWTLSLLDIKPHDRVLEIGFGPGIAIEQISNSTKAGFIAGVDHSEVMVKQATKRNAGAIRDGKVAVHLGSASTLPEFGQQFDKIFTINSIHFWTDPIDCLKQLRKLLRPGGTIAITLQPRSQGATDATAKMIGKEIAAKLECAGFSKCRLEIKKIAPISAVCVLSTK
jgi:SAM-dependent methyltransferase